MGVRKLSVFFFFLKVNYSFNPFMATVTIVYISYFFWQMNEMSKAFLAFQTA